MRIRYDAWLWGAPTCLVLPDQDGQKRMIRSELSSSQLRDLVQLDSRKTRDPATRVQIPKAHRVSHRRGRVGGHPVYPLIGAFFHARLWLRDTRHLSV